MIDDEVSYLWGVCAALSGWNLLFSHYNTTRTLCEGGKDGTSLHLSKRCSWIKRLSPPPGPLIYLS